MGSSTIPAGGAGGGLEPKYQKFTSSGTFTLPDGYGAAKPLLINIQIIGGGGGGVRETLVTSNVSPIGTYTASGYFGNGGVGNVNWVGGVGTSAGPGGSGGIAATQMYLTSNLTINANLGRMWNDSDNANRVLSNYNSINASGGTGGFSQAGSVKSGGGVGATGTGTIVAYAENGGGANAATFSGTQTAGVGGSPAGTTGGATPLLGTIAGGSNTSTPINGSFGVGGNSTDVATSTGVDGTGGGFNSVGASGAVIITWWQ